MMYLGLVFAICVFGDLRELDGDHSVRATAGGVHLRAGGSAVGSTFLRLGIDFGIAKHIMFAQSVNIKLS